VGRAAHPGRLGRGQRGDERPEHQPDEHQQPDQRRPGRVSNAVIAYNNGQQDMAAAYQSELVKSAQSGDFTYFVQHQATR